MSVSINGTNGLVFNDASTQNTAATGFGFKNRIINGAMMIDQRNAGASVTPTSTSYVTVDRWRAIADASSKYSIQQVSDAPTGFNNSLKMTSLSAYTVGSTEVFGTWQAIEGFNTADLAFGTANAKTVTLSFWVKSSLTGTFGGSLQNADYTRGYPFSYTISSANTWEQKSVTIAGDTTGTWVGATNGIGMLAFFSIGSGSSRSNTAGAWTGTQYSFSATGATSVVGTNGATFYITGVQLEKGSTATSFDYRPYGTELALCQRYYQVGKATQFVAASTTQANGIVPLAVVMRAEPSIARTGTIQIGDMVSYGSNSTGTPFVDYSSNNVACTVNMPGFTGLTQYRSYRHEPSALYPGIFSMSAEL